VDLVLTQNNSFQSIQLITPTGSGPTAVIAEPASVPAVTLASDDSGAATTKLLRRYHRRRIA
jgi:hypothetical protein